jgi:hypothetical protein
MSAAELECAALNPRCTDGSSILSPRMEFLRSLWGDLNPDIRAQYREAILTLNRLFIILILHFAFRGMDLMEVDKELMMILHCLHKWATVVIFGAFLIDMTVRSVAGALRLNKEKDGAQ